jgi:glutathione synthase/RimK-type ligase-like ATP-grasp enzyme
MFKNALWVNYPVSTYYAENKICQLTEAHKIGFSIPDSLATNNSSKIVEKFSSHEKIICKSIDTLMFEENENEAFCYSKPISLKTIDVSSINKIPAFYQHYLSPKIDYRVTVVDNDIFAVQIINNGKGVEGDWRLLKDSVLFVEDSLPKLIKEKCISITRNLGLKFGAIDLAYHNDQFYFIEINPTGEWGWLVEAANQPIHISIVKLLCGTN